MDYSTPGFPVLHHLLQLPQTFTASSFRIWNSSTGIPSFPLALFVVMLLKAHLKLWAMPYRATQDGQVMVENSDKTWSTGEGNGKPLQCSCLENPMNSMKRQKVMTLKDKLPRLVDAQYAPGEEKGYPLQYSGLENSMKVGHNRATSLSLFPFMHWRRKWQPTPVFLPGESLGRRSLVGCSPLKRLSSIAQGTPLSTLWWPK